MITIVAERDYAWKLVKEKKKKNIYCTDYNKDVDSFRTRKRKVWHVYRVCANINSSFASVPTENRELYTGRIIPLYIHFFAFVIYNIGVWSVRIGYFIFVKTRRLYCDAIESTMMILFKNATFYMDDFTQSAPERTTYTFSISLPRTSIYTHVVSEICIECNFHIRNISTTSNSNLSFCARIATV